MNQRMRFVVLAALVCLLTACGTKAPAAEAAVAETASAPAEPIREQVTADETFTSTDGTAEYTMKIDQYLSADPLPIVEVVPWDLTGEDVERVARAFFPEAVFYERTKYSDPEYTRGQLQYLIDLLSELNEEGLRELYGPVDQDTLNLVGRYIQIYTQLLAKAPEGEFREPFEDWIFRREDYHADYYNGNKNLCATTEVGDLHYNVYAIIREKGDYKYNRIFLDLGEGLGLHYEKSLLRAKLCRTAEPTQEQVEAAVEKAQNILDRMELGQWKVSSWQVLVDDGDGAHAPEYKIEVRAVPVVAGIPALEGQIIYNFQSEEEEASNYMASSAGFLFSADGTPVYFDMTAPIREVQVVQEAVSPLSVGELLDCAQTHLGQLDPGDGIGIPFDSDFFFIMHGESATSKIRVTSFEYGLSRKKVPGKDFHYYYVPTLVFYGGSEYYGADSGVMLESSAKYGDGIDDILWLDATDGTMIPQI